MPTTQFTAEPGELVRYQATTAKWYFGTFRRSNGNHVEVKFFWGDTELLPQEAVQRFRDFLDSRQRVLSLTRMQLCNAFFGDPLLRLNKKRAKRIKESLRRHGLAFEPADWPSPGTRIQLSRDKSVVRGRKSRKDHGFELLLPHWLEAYKLPPSSRDPLGLQSLAEGFADELLPGLTVTTNRIGYYGFLTWVIQKLNDAACPSGRTREELLHRLERALVLCEFVYHGAEEDSCRLLGQRSKTHVLQSAMGDRFQVPKRILKNQASAGAYRLYYTSLQSLGFVQEDIDLAAKGLLPMRLTELGGRLAHAFEQRLSGKFFEFALNDGVQGRSTIKSWGERLCFSTLGDLGRYRGPLLEGLIFGNSLEAEKRFRTVHRLFQRGLLTGDYDYEGKIGEAPNEEIATEGDADTPEESAATGLTNDEVLLHFYEESPRVDNRDFQSAAVFELLALGLNALFQAMTEDLRRCGRARPTELATRLASQEDIGQHWGPPWFSAVADAPNARQLVQQLLNEGDALRRGAIGGTLLGRVLLDQPLAVLANDLATNPAFALVQEILRSRPERSLAEAYPDLVRAMIDRHEAVSLRKNRQRWCCLNGDVVCKDDLQEMRVVFHAFRFPQLYSLCWDLGLDAEDLQNGH